MTPQLPSTLTESAHELRPFKDVRLVAADLDGTLVGRDGRLWRQILGQISALRHHGVRFTVATGRTLAGVRPLLETGGPLIREPLVLYNGAIVAERESGRVLLRHEIPPTAVMEVAGLAKDDDVDVLAYVYHGPDETLLAAGGEQVVGWTRAADRPAAEFNGQPIDWQREAVPVSACAILVDVRAARTPVPELVERLRGVSGLTVTSSGGVYLELRPEGSQKWAALERVAAHLDIDPGATLALGDGDNDIELLKGAGIGVCVADASERLRAHADYVARHEAAGAVLETLRTVRWAMRFGDALDRLHPPAAA